MHFGRLLWVLGVVAACSVNLEPLDDPGAGGGAGGHKDASSDKPGLDVCVTCGGGGTPTGGQGGTSAGGSAGAGSGGVAGATGGGGAAGTANGGTAPGGGGTSTGGTGATGGTTPICLTGSLQPPPVGCPAAGFCQCMGCGPDPYCDPDDDCMCLVCDNDSDCNAGCNNDGQCDPYVEGCGCTDCKPFCS